MDLLYVVLRTLLICAIGLLIAFQGRRMGLSIFNLTGRLNRLQFIICFIALMILFHIVHYIDDLFLDFVVSLPAYWFTRVIIWILLAALFPLSCILFGRRIHDIGFNAWAGILWSVIMYLHQYPTLLYLHSITYLSSSYGSSVSYSGYCLVNQNQTNMVTHHLCL